MKLQQLALRLRPRRLSTRIVVLSLGLLLAVQGIGFGVISDGIERNARARLAMELEVGERVWHRLVEQKAQALRQGAALLVADYGFRDAVASGDEATIASALENHGARIGARASAWLGPDFQVLAMHPPEAGASHERLQQVVRALVEGRRDTTLAVLGSFPEQVIVVPLKAPQPIGWVVMRFPIDQAFLADMRAVSGLQVALLAGIGDGSLVPVGSTLRDQQAQALVGQPAETPTLAGEAMLARRVSLVHDGTHSAEVRLYRSVDEAVAPYRRLQWLLGVITLAGVAVFAVGSVVTARRVTQPLTRLVRASDRLGRGEAAEPLADLARGDEVGELAQAFERMRLNIAAHQAEKDRLATTDKLTGLPNRAGFSDRVAAAILAGTAPGSRLAVLMLDLDRFKPINDVLGYAFGDLVLNKVAKRLCEVRRREDEALLARLSGDKFALLLPSADVAQARAMAQRIAVALERPLKLDDQTVDLSAGYGIACWPADAEDADTLLARAEVAMYASKRKTDPVVAYDASIDSASAETLSLLSSLRRAVERNELRLFVQPKVALAHGRIVGAEALVRWQHPDRGMVPPLDFIPFAEQTGFVRELTAWMFQEAARRWPLLASTGIQRLSINLSTRDLMDSELPSRLLTILAGAALSPAAFCLEITESAIMEEPQRAEATVRALSKAGFKLSIDDFGTGYSSLGYLQRLPVNELKIDKSFVMAMDRNAGDLKIVRSTIDLAHNLGLAVVAEGVENLAVWQHLRTLGCDEAQGYWITRPMPVEDLPGFAARWANERADSAVAALH